MNASIKLLDLEPAEDDLLGDVLAGLSATPKRLPSKYFYDATGSRLFERICEQPEYYLTRTELAIMREHAEDMARALGPGVRLVEYGSGAGLKTRQLLEVLQAPVAYVPVEISRSALLASVERLSGQFPGIEMLPVCADFTQRVALPEPTVPPRRTVVYFPGSTLGNFENAVAIRLLAQMRALVGPGGAVLLGLDRKKDVATIEAAYNDAAGVTAEFTLNLLVRLNRELGADFEPGDFRHDARYDAVQGRIQTHIVSTRAQSVNVGGQVFEFGEGEPMLVEYSCKYDQADVERMADLAGLVIERTWADPAGQFSVQLLVHRGD
jgi:dimethylhistidine N-methyltransferase